MLLRCPLPISKFALCLAGIIEGQDHRNSSVKLSMYPSAGTTCPNKLDHYLPVSYPLDSKFNDNLATLVVPRAVLQSG